MTLVCHANATIFVPFDEQATEYHDRLGALVNVQVFPESAEV
jgi:hypothetical protein